MVPSPSPAPDDPREQPGAFARGATSVRVLGRAVRVKDPRVDRETYEVKPTHRFPHTKWPDLLLKWLDSLPNRDAEK